MGGVLSSLWERKVTRQEVKQLMGSFQEVSDSLDFQLPLIRAFRYGGLILTILGAVNMLLGSVNQLNGMGKACPLIFFGLILQVLGFLVHRVCVIKRVRGLLEEFHRVVPTAKDTSDVPTVGRDWFFTAAIVVLHGISWMNCGPAEGWQFLLGLLQLVADLAFFRWLVRNGNVAKLKTICQRRLSESVGAVLRSNEDP